MLSAGRAPPEHLTAATISATGPGWSLSCGDWRDVFARPGAPDRFSSLITDAPYSELTHASRPTRDDGSDAAGSTPDYDPWTPDDVWQFVHDWDEFVDGWMVVLTDDVLIPAWRTAYREVGRVDFAPVPCVIPGMTCRVRGDGPSSWAVYAMVGRPRSAEMASWGTLPGDYRSRRSAEAGGGRGKPPDLMRALVRDYSRPGDLVVDPLAGWGSTLEAAVGLGRRAVGAEICAEAYDEAVRRLRRGVQTDLLSPVPRAAVQAEQFALVQEPPTAEAPRRGKARP